MRRRELVALIEEGRVRRGDPTIRARGPRGRAGEEVERGHGWAQHFGLPSGIIRLHTPFVKRRAAGLMMDFSF